MSFRSLPLVPWDRKPLLSARNSETLITATLINAMDLMMLGRIEEANRLLSALNDHYSFQIEGSASHVLKSAFHFAWAASGKWPDYVISPDESKPEYVRLYGFEGHLGDSEEWLAKLEEDVRLRWPERIKNAYPDYKKEDLNSAIVELNGNQGASGKFELLLCVLEIALTLGEDEQAKELVKEHALDEFVALAENIKKEGDYSAHIRRHVVAQSRQVWRLLLDGAIAEHFDVDEKSLKDYVDEGVDIINRRLTNGPVRLFADKNIKDLVEIMDTNYIKARKLDPHQGRHMIVPDFKSENVPETWLKPGASEEEIAELEKRLGEDGEPLVLPDDYKDFLRLSNGYYVDGPDDQTGIFYGSSAIEKDAPLDEIEVGVNLIPYEYLSVGLMEAFDPWPESGNVASLGAGGDEGYICLVPPDKVKEGIKHFNEVYKNANEPDKRIIERACRDLYGDVEELRKLQWVVIDWAHWSPEAEVYVGFKGYLEDAAQYAVNEAEVAGRKPAKNKEDAPEMDPEDESNDDEDDSNEEKDEDDDNEENDEDLEDDGNDDAGDTLEYSHRNKKPRTG